MLLRYPDGTLASVCRSQLVGAVVDAARDTRPDGLLDVLDLLVLGWTLPAEVAATLNAERGAAFTGHSPDDIDYVVGVDRARQLAAIAAHASQALSTSVLWRRLDLLGTTEHLRRLRAPDSPANGVATSAV